MDTADRFMLCGVKLPEFQKCATAHIFEFRPGPVRARSLRSSAAGSLFSCVSASFVVKSTYAERSEQNHERQKTCNEKDGTIIPP
jgi:hypothetical protein